MELNTSREDSVRLRCGSSWILVLGILLLPLPEGKAGPSKASKVLPPLEGVPEVYRAAIQGLRQDRVRMLPGRIMKLGDEALRQYFRLGMPPGDADLVEKAMAATDATAFLPDLELILSLPPEATQKIHDVATVKEVIRSARAKAFLSYRDLNRALDAYMGTATDLHYFPMILRYAEANPMSKSRTADLFVSGMAPIEVTLNPKEGYSIVDFSKHDQSHYESLLSSAPAERDHPLAGVAGFEELVEREQFSHDYARAQLRYETVDNYFFRFHELPRDTVTDYRREAWRKLRNNPEARVKWLNAISARDALMEANNPFNKLPGNLLRKAKALIPRVPDWLSDPDPVMREAGIRFMEGAERGGFNLYQGRPLELLTQALRDPDVGVRRLAVRFFHVHRVEVNADTVHTMAGLLADADPEIQVMAWKWIRYSCSFNPKSMTYLDTPELKLVLGAAATLPNGDGSSSTDALSRLFGNEFHEDWTARQRLEAALRQLDPDSQKEVTYWVTGAGRDKSALFKLLCGPDGHLHLDAD